MRKVDSRQQSANQGSISNIKHMEKFVRKSALSAPFMTVCWIETILRVDSELPIDRTGPHKRYSMMVSLIVISIADTGHR